MRRHSKLPVATNGAGMAIIPVLELRASPAKGIHGPFVLACLLCTQHGRCNNPRFLRDFDKHTKPACRVANDRHGIHYGAVAAAGAAAVVVVVVVAAAVAAAVVVLQLSPVAARRRRLLLLLLATAARVMCMVKVQGSDFVFGFLVPVLLLASSRNDQIHDSQGTPPAATALRCTAARWDSRARPRSCARTRLQCACRAALHSVTFPDRSCLQLRLFDNRLGRELVPWTPWN